MMSNAKDFLRFAISIGAMEFIPAGRKLNSGRMSPYFFNSGLFRTGGTLGRLASWYANELRYEGSLSLGEAVLFGPAYKGIPLVAAIATALYQEQGFDVGYAFNRKEEKDHGEGGLIVGCPVEGKTVFVVDDVITTGGSIDEAFGIIRQYGGRPGACYIAFDREERGVESEYSAVQEFERKHEAAVYPIARLRDLIELFRTGDVSLTNTEIQTMLPLLLEYQKKYGV